MQFSAHFLTPLRVISGRFSIHGVLSNRKGRFAEYAVKTNGFPMILSTEGGHFHGFRGVFAELGVGLCPSRVFVLILGPFGGRFGGPF